MPDKMYLGGNILDDKRYLGEYSADIMYLGGI